MPEQLNLDDLIKKVEGAQLKIRELQQSLEHEIGPGLQLKTWDGSRWLIQGYQIVGGPPGIHWNAAYANTAILHETHYTPACDTLLEAYIAALRAIMRTV